MLRNRRTWIGVAIAVGVVVLAVAATVNLKLGAPSGGWGNGLSRFDDGEISLEYPSRWHVIASDVLTRHYQWFPVVLGTGDWDSGCDNQSSEAGIDGPCGNDSVTIPPGGVVVQVHTKLGPPRPAAVTPREAIELGGGVWAIEQRLQFGSRWSLYIPGWMYPLVVDARFHPTDAEDVRPIIENLVMSIRLPESARQAGSTPEE